MTVKVFVDTNVLVYSRDASEPEKQERDLDWMTHLWTTQTGRLRFQVLQEFYVTVTRKLDPGLDSARARSDVRALLAWHPVQPDRRVIEDAWLVQDRYRFSWWDALIIAAARVVDCRYLLTEDLQEDQEVGNLHVINPFRRSPAFLSR